MHKENFRPDKSFIRCISSMITFRPGFFYIFSRHLLKVAMGQGQSEIAMKLLTDCARDGDWLCLKNLHLVTAWLPKLEKVRSSKVGIENNLYNVYNRNLSRFCFY